MLQEKAGVQRELRSSALKVGYSSQPCALFNVRAFPFWEAHPRSTSASSAESRLWSQGNLYKE